MAAEEYYRKSELALRTAEFLRENGAWAKFCAAEEALCRCIRELHGIADFRSHRTELDAREAGELILGAPSLNGEFYHGMAADMQYQVIRNLKQRPLEHRIAELVQRFETKHSQLTGGSTADDTPLSRKLGIAAENPRQALTRCADEIEAWTKVNDLLLNQYEVDSIARDLKRYRAAYVGVLDYMDFARNCCAQLVLDTISTPLMR